MPETSKTPWITQLMAVDDPACRLIAADNSIIGAWVSPEDAELIVRAVNSHQALVEALETMSLRAEMLANLQAGHDFLAANKIDFVTEMGKANAALKLAKGA